VFDRNAWGLVSDKEIVIDNIRAHSLLLRNFSGTERNIIYWYDIAGVKLINRSKIKLLQAVEAYRKPNSRAEIVAFYQKNTTEEVLVRNVKYYLQKLNDLKVVVN
jgi:hypothetical protein